MKSFCLMLLVLTGTLRGAPAESFRTDINPALLYYRALLVASEPLSEADLKYLASKKAREQKLPERFGKFVTGSDNQFLLIRQAAHCTVPCDWGLDFAAGPNLLLPHLGRAKAATQMAQLRARWALENGRPEVAREDIVAAFVLGRHVANDGLMISALVQCMIEGLNYSTVANYFGEFSPETLQQLVEGFDAAPPRHTMAETIRSEKLLGDWLFKKVLELRKMYPNDDAKVMAAFRDSGYVTAMETVGETNVWGRIVAASGGTSEGVLKLLRETESVFPRLAKLMALTAADYEAEAQQFSAEIIKSPNPFINAMGIMLDKWFKNGVRPTEFKVLAQLAMVHAAVDYKLHGEAGLKSVQDPFGNGPFGFRRFVFKGVDRGFELTSAYTDKGSPFVMIFMEKQGPAFEIMGPDAGKAITQ